MKKKTKRPAAKKKAQHGGVRVAGPGKKLGRPPTDAPNKKTLSLRVSPEVRAFLDSVENKSEHVDFVIRRSAAFRKWADVSR